MEILSLVLRRAWVRARPILRLGTAISITPSIAGTTGVAHNFFCKRTIWYVIKPVPPSQEGIYPDFANGTGFPDSLFISLRGEGAESPVLKQVRALAKREARTVPLLSQSAESARRARRSFLPFLSAKRYITKVAMRKRNRAAAIHMTQWMSLARPWQMRTITKARMPNMMPLAME